MMDEELKDAMQQQKELIGRIEALESEKGVSGDVMLSLYIDLLDVSSRCAALIQLRVKELNFAN